MQRTAFYLFISLLFIGLQAGAQPLSDVSFISTANNTGPRGDSIVAATTETSESMLHLLVGIAASQRTSGAIGVTKQQRPVQAFFFPGRSAQRALVIGGVHGTELASIEVAAKLVANLTVGDTPFYSVLVIPSLFPDNAAQALEQPDAIGSVQNIGRYSTAEAADPNRQMPPLGKPYDPQANTDALGRPVEYENGLLLQLIQTYRPHRIVNIHAIRDTAQGGIYADPRTDASGYAFDFTTDSSLAITMAKYIEQQGGLALGNRISSQPTAVYYKDPPVVASGQWQRRNCHGAALPDKRGQGVSLGSWASTAVQDSTNAALNRDAIRLLTMEFPGYKRPQDYAEGQQSFYENQVALYATSIQRIFLEAFFTEGASANNTDLAEK